MYYITFQKCPGQGCAAEYQLLIEQDFAPATTARYEYDCKECGRRVLFSVITATKVMKVPMDAVKATRR